ncbi:MAG: hypothetical protein QXJ96_02125 [Candidatus Aenigmatarchaeota archaeon]|nr:hypothetical protein [Candidatus Aenigmarchaeota archaeon]
MLRGIAMKLRVNRGYREYLREEVASDTITDDDIKKEYFVSMYIEPENEEDMELIKKMHRLKMYRDFDTEFLGSTPEEAEKSMKKIKKI